MKQWITLLSIANTRCDTTSGKASREVAQLKTQVAQLEKTGSRSPRGAKGSGKSSRSYPALQDSTPQASNKGKGGRVNGDKSNKSGGGKEKSQHTGPFADLLNKVGYKVLHKHNKTNPGFCFPFQSGSCSKQNCRQHHNCASTVQRLPIPGSPLNVIGRSIGLAAFQHGDASWRILPHIAGLTQSSVWC